MKNKKLSLHAIILGVAVLAIVAYSILSSIAFKPTVTEGEFPFSITYELDGKTVTINEVYKARYDRNDGYADTKTRVYVGGVGDSEDGSISYVLKREGNTRIELYTNLYPDYLMGDSEYDYFEGEAFEPKIYYYDADEIEYSDEETLAAHGVKLISFEYPTPIKNPLVFSHISYLSGAVVLPILLLALIALIVMISCIRKEKELKYKAVDVASIVLNFVIGFTIIPFVTILAFFINVEGGGPELYYQIIYFIPALSVLCTAASVALRRKGHGVMSLITTLIGPAVFAIYLIIFYTAGLFF